MRLSVLIWCVGIFVLAGAKAQDPIFSQFYNAPNQINPAFAGNTVGALVATNYRLQWPGFSSVYNTYMLSYDQFVPRFNSGFGATILSDDAGDGTLKTTKVSGLYSYRVLVRNKTYIKLGMELGIVQSRLDPSKLLFYDQIELGLGSVSPGGSTIPTQENLSNVGTRFYPDMGAGIMIYSSKFYGGIGLKHLNNPDNTFLNESVESIEAGIPTRFTVHAGMQIDLEKGNNRANSSFISPNIVFVKQGPFRQINAGAYIDFGSFFTGLWYRDTANNGDAVIGSMGVRSGIFKISYSYDATVSGIGGTSGGAHELGIIFNFDSLLPKQSKYNDCLSLFR